MRCEYVELGRGTAKRYRHRCAHCGHVKESDHPAKRLHRLCPAREDLIPQDPDRRPLVLVLGVHRSLSSCVAELLEKLGVFMGITTRGGESNHLAYVCETILPFPTIEPPIGPCSRRGKIEHWAKTHMGAAGDRPAGAKYPTLCRLARDVERAWPHLRIIHCARPLAESIESLVARAAAAKSPQWQASREQCEKLQRHLFACKQRFLARRPHLTILAEDLLAAPALQIDRLIEYLRPIGLDPTAEQRRAAVEHVQPAKSRHSQRLRVRRRWTDDTTVLIKTFERPRCLQTSINSIRERWPEARILVADDSRRPQKRHDVTVLAMGFDAGLAAGRNLLVERAQTPYVLLCDDDTIFTDETDAERLRAELDRTGLDVLAVTVHQTRFAGVLSLEDRVLRHRRGNRGQDGPVRICDVVDNCFLARTEALRRVPWDGRLKVGEHLDWSLRAWQAGLRIGWLEGATAINRPIRDRHYSRYRNRARTLRNEALGRWAAELGFDRFVSEVCRGAAFRSTSSCHFALEGGYPWTCICPATPTTWPTSGSTQPARRARSN